VRVTVGRVRVAVRPGEGLPANPHPTFSRFTGEGVF
jgi:hypothetical protein